MAIDCMLARVVGLELKYNVARDRLRITLRGYWQFGARNWTATPARSTSKQFAVEMTSPEG